MAKEIKAGDFVRCLKTEEDSFTFGKIYQVSSVISDGARLYFLHDDSGQENSWSIKHFEKVPPPNPGVRHMVIYILDSTSYIKFFKTIPLMERFITAFNKEHKAKGPYSGYWIDLVVTGITGEVVTSEQIEKEAMK